MAGHPVIFFVDDFFLHCLTNSCDEPIGVNFRNIKCNFKVEDIKHHQYNSTKSASEYKFPGLFYICDFQ